jgi:carbon-monoxide dehydrogenase medium subunit
VEYFEPRSLDEACELAERYAEDGKVLAGGTALVLLMRQKLLAPTALVNIQRVAELGGIRRENGSIWLGALATHAEAARSALIREHYPALAQTFAHVATPRIRNAGTVGGNLAHGDPHLDPPVSLLALNARVGIRSTAGSQDIPLADLLLDYYETSLQPSEILTGVRIPARAPRSGLAFLKFLPRSQDDYATVDVAVWLRLAENDTVAEARIALGSVGPTVLRPGEAEAVLIGSHLEEDALAEAGRLAAAASDPEDDVRGSAAYKRELIKVLVGRVAKQALADASGS